MSSKKVTVNLLSLADKINNKSIIIYVDNDYNILDFIIHLISIDSIYNSYSLSLPDSGLISPKNVLDKLYPQVKNEIINVRMYSPLCFRNSFNYIGNLIGLYNYNLLETCNITDVDSINQAKFGEWIGFGKGPISVPKIEDNRIMNLLWVIYNTEKPVVYNIHCLKEIFNRNNKELLIPHLNKKIKPDKFAIAYYSNEKFKILRINGNDIIRD